MFERFTTEARDAVRLSQQEARELGHPFIGTEHLLLGVAAVPGAAAQVLTAHELTVAHLRQRVSALTDGLDSDALASLGIDLERVRQVTEAHLGPGALSKPRRPVKDGHLPITTRSKKALELSLRESLHLKSGEIGSGHLLLGLIREGEGTACRLLRDAHVDLDELRTEIYRLIQTRAA